jgi:ATP-dependent Clp protease ATP-binding subunit ClpC
MIRVSFLHAVPDCLCARARKAFQLANQEAHRLNHHAVGPEHLLLGLAKEGESPGAWALRWSGFDLRWLRCQVECWHERGPDEDVLPGALPYTADLVAFIDQITAGPAQRPASVAPQHLLAALIREPEYIVADILRRRRLSWWLLRLLLRKVADPRAIAAWPRE